jgi:hypothetical protein
MAKRPNSALALWKHNSASQSAAQKAIRAAIANLGSHQTHNKADALHKWKKEHLRSHKDA